MRAASLIMLALGLAPAPLLAEGARITLTCTATKACDAAGSCAPDSMQTSFTFAPATVDDTGAGAYDLTHDGAALTATALSRLGPFAWSAGPDDSEALLVTGAAQALWQVLTPSTGTSTLHFLACEVTQ
ncbi:MAG: hypothetical protein GC146_12840 [Limimaricola sp.]|uniref:hypothetical protein n=1 Tax=Limimaricola sp. TaxID=2211665 RepID=UPI001DE160B3|nr:hypothetical protein [Limimaricola sp.]MBI1418101.1 hypothetical protein [Limimaricola sp.]